MDELEGLIEFAENPEPRCALALVLDTSGSMSGEPIQELKAGLALLAEELRDDSLASQRVEVAIITFGAGGVTVAQDFTIAEDFDPPALKAGGRTPLGKAVVTATQLIADRKKTYKDAGIAYFRPWIFLITDGVPTDDWSKARDLVHQGDTANAFAFFAVAVADADMEVLAELSPRGPIKLQGLAFRELFQWLSQSQRQVSSSRPGDQVALPATTGWAEV
jgi:uncharacterized protein YegL